MVYIINLATLLFRFKLWIIVFRRRLTRLLNALLKRNITEAEEGVCCICDHSLETQRVYPTYSHCENPYRCRKHVFHFLCLSPLLDNDIELANCPFCGELFDGCIFISDPLRQLWEERERSYEIIGSPSYQCTTCSKIFQSRSGRYKCEQKHAKLFKCSVCATVFTQQYSLTRHKRKQRHI